MSDSSKGIASAEPRAPGSEEHSSAYPDKITTFASYLCAKFKNKPITSYHHILQTTGLVILSLSVTPPSASLISTQ
jgi:hypothetical protein